MELLLGPVSLQVPFKFQVFKSPSSYLINEKLGHFNKIGIYISGGIDSLALLCLVLTELTDRKDIPVICFTVNKNTTTTDNAAVIIKEVSAKFNREIQHVSGIPNEPDAILKGIIGPTTIQSVYNYSPNMITYMGANRMSPDRPFTQSVEVEYGQDVVTSHYFMPFLHLDKPHILDLIYKLGCDDLIKYTQSCHVVSPGGCGACYSCKERAWGFSALNKTDPIL